MNKVKLLATLIAAMLSFNKALTAAGLNDEAKPHLHTAATHCPLVDSDKWGIAIVMAAHPEFKSWQPKTCREALEVLLKHLDPKNRCLSELGAKWANKDLSGFSGAARCSAYTTGLRDHPFSEDPDSVMDRLRKQCSKKCPA